MLYTRKGDKGTTKTFGCDQRISKSSAIAEALGALDETNSTLGVLRAKCSENDSRFSILDSRFEQILLRVQQNLFIIQAELAGAEGKTISEEKIKEIESYIDAAEKEMPPIKSFFIPGATELGAMFDVARTVARRAERRVTAVIDSFDKAQDKAGGRLPAPHSSRQAGKIGIHSQAYLNRLSSLLYALARLSSHKSGINEQPPSYK